MNRQRKPARNSRGTVAIEYGLIAIVLSAAASVPMLDLGNQVSTTVTNMVWNLRAS
jgi:Flp pilus assembly pilin Flp